MNKDRPILYLAAGQTLVWAGLFYVFPALLVRWEEALGWSRAELTAAITLAILLSALASPLAGRLIDAGRGPQMMTASAVLGGISLAALSTVTELWQFYLVWALIGISLSGCLYEPCFALITRARGSSAKQAIILITLMAGFASTISFPAAHALAGSLGWRSTVQVFAIAVIGLAAPLLWLGASRVESAGDGRISTPGEARAVRRAFLAKPQFWLLALGFAFAALAYGVTLQHMLPILYDRGIAPDVAIIAAAFIGPMQVAGRLAVMASARHVTNHGVAKACFVGMGLSTLVLIATGTTPALLALFVILFGGAYGTVSIIRPVISRDILGETNFGAKYGVMALFYLAGSALAPWLGSLVWGIGGYDLVLPGLIVLAMIGLGFYLAAERLARREAGGPSSGN